MNDNNYGLIVGGTGYAAILKPDTIISVLEPDASGTILKCALNDNNYGIMGGEGGYAAIIEQASTITQLSPLSGSPGTIYTVALNQNNYGLLGGSDGYTSVVYRGLGSNGTENSAKDEIGILRKKEESQLKA